MFDEILVNAADNKINHDEQSEIKIRIEKDGMIEIRNDGHGIYPTYIEEYGQYAPELIFGESRTSSNFDANEQRIVGGKNGMGAKLVNIFSSRFELETICRGKLFKMAWERGKPVVGSMAIKPTKKKDGTIVRFKPDEDKFGTSTTDIVDLYRKRAFDIAGTESGLKISFNGTAVPIASFEQYCQYYAPDALYHKPTNVEARGRWEVAFSINNSSDVGNVSFCNSVATIKDGKHVDVVADQIVTHLLSVINSAKKGELVRPAQVRKFCTFFVNAKIENPDFDDQKKECMTTIKSKHGSKPLLSKKYLQEIEQTGIVDVVLKSLNQRARVTRQRTAKVDKLTDAKKAGGANARQCVLIITEGDSAKTSALSGIAALSDKERQCYGVMAIKGKILNVRKSEQKAVNKNDEINNLISAWGLDYNRTYDNEADLNTLRYGKLMIMADQDDDGFHIKGLVLNFIQFYWPALIERVYQFKTPLIKARRKDKTVEFYTEAEFSDWAKDNELTKWRIKHYKGLGTSTADEFRAYFRQMTHHTQQFAIDNESTALDDAFSRDEIDTRKQFILTYNDDDNYVDHDQDMINVDDFVQYQLGNYFLSSATRAIPSVVDGLKDVQRKIMWVCLNRRNNNEEIKVAQLAGAVAQKTAYHHGENSIQGAIVIMARSIVGTRPGANINLLEPIGQFGSRLEGGKDCAAPRYIFTRLSPIAKHVFNAADDAIYSYTSDDGKRREPDYYAPVIPMILVNGSYGLGVGFATNIPAHCPIALVESIKAMIDGRDDGELKPIEPWYRGFTGEIRTNDKIKNAFTSYGRVKVIKRSKKDIHAQIVELPLGIWTQDYVDKLKKWKGDGLIKDFDDLSDDVNVNITVKLENKLKKNDDLVKYLKLKKPHNYGNGLVCLNHRGQVTIYESTREILKDYFDVRSNLYQKRYDSLLVEKQARVEYTSNQLRFLSEKSNFESKSKAEVINMFRQGGYRTNPLVDTGKDDFDYLLNMPFYYQTTEKRNELIERELKQMREYDEHRLRRTAADLWKSDLDSLLLKLR